MYTLSALLILSQLKNKISFSPIFLSSRSSKKEHFKARLSSKYLSNLFLLWVCNCLGAVQIKDNDNLKSRSSPNCFKNSAIMIVLPEPVGDLNTNFFSPE